MEEEVELVFIEKFLGIFLSGFFDCINVIFSKVQCFWEFNLVVYKEICVVLVVVIEVICFQGGKEMEIEYFVVLMIIMEVVEFLEFLVVVVYLLNFVLKCVFSFVFIKKFFDIFKVFMDIMLVQVSSGFIFVF